MNFFPVRVTPLYFPSLSPYSLLMSETLRLNGLAVRAIRERSGIQQQDLAASCNISAPYLANIERGIKSPRSPLAVQIAEQLQVPLAAITYPARKESAA